MEQVIGAMDVRDAEWVTVAGAGSVAWAAEVVVDFKIVRRETLPTVQSIGIPERIWKLKRKNWKLN